MSTASFAISEKVRQIVDASYDKARDKWPVIEWTSEDYLGHVKRKASQMAFSDDDYESLHLADVFVAGAAGHRIDPAWEVIDNDFGPKVINILKKLPKADYSLEELWAETRLRQIEEDKEESPLPDNLRPARIGRYAGRVPLLNYLVTVARRLAIQRHKKHKPEVGLVHESSDDQTTSSAPYEDNREAQPDAPMESGEIAQMIQKAMLGAFRELTRDRQMVIALVVRDGMKQKEAADLLGWSESKVNRQLEPALTQLWEAMQTLKLTDNESDEAPRLRTMLLAFRAYFGAIHESHFPMPGASGS